jgi:hypothetical protein
MGGIISSQSVSVAAGDDEIYIFPWMPPNPHDYAGFGADQSHFCLLARIETSVDAPYGMTFPETSNLYENVQNNNNIVWKNITVVEDTGGGRMASIVLANFTGERQRARLVFQIPKNERISVFDWGHVYAELPPRLGEQVKEEKEASVQRIDKTTFRILKRGATLGTFELGTKDMHAVHVRFVPLHKQPMGARVFSLDLVQMAGDRVIGGQRFIIKTTPDLRGIAIDKPLTRFDGVSWVPVCGIDHGCHCCCCQEKL